MTIFERDSKNKGYHRPAGVDEAGRGPLAGPVVAAACIIPEGVWLPGVDDSKKLTPAARRKLYNAIISDTRILYGLAFVSPLEIDQLNIYQATIQAMYRAIDKLSIQPDVLLVDGMNLNHAHIPCIKIVGGDGKSQSIAAASIIAKVSRDMKMEEYHEQWPEYGFLSHKGYGTEEHRKAILDHGPCPIHRLTFEPLKSLV